GMKVCRADQGNAASFTCAYHGWTYGNDGKLIGVPNFQDAYFEQLDMEQWGLVPVAQVDSYKGLIFGTFDPAAPALSDYLGDMRYYLDWMLDRREGGTEIVGGTHKWIMPCNWKLPSDNFIGDTYHIGTSHLSAIIVGARGESFRAQAPTAFGGFQTTTGNGHGVIVREGLVTAGELDIMDYEKSILPEVERRLGKGRAGIAPIVSTVFPNCSPFYSRWTIRVWHPRGPRKTE